MGWLPSAPQFKTNPLEVAKPQGRRAKRSPHMWQGKPEIRFDLEMSCEDPDNPAQRGPA